LVVLGVTLAHQLGVVVIYRRVPMIDMIEGLPEQVLGFKAVGTVTGEDYENTIIPAVLAMAERLHHVRLLYVLGDEFDGFDAKAMLDDAMLGVSRYTAWERVAVVTDVAWLRMSVQAMHFVMPGHFRLFHVSDLDAAKAWLSET
jgi:hypothetical protein